MQDTDYTLLSFGDEQQPVIIIDDFADNVDQLQALGRAATYGEAGRHYPGMRARAPAEYLQARGALLGNILRDVFGCLKGADLIECNFSIVTTPQADLTPIQRLPHFDGADTQKLALLHYLSPAEAGGTSFYRHRETGFETITADRLPAYDACLRKEITRDGLPPARYFSDSTAQFECIGQVEARYNRMIIYRGITLHSGNIDQSIDADTSPATARLTLNTFLSAR